MICRSGLLYTARMNVTQSRRRRRGRGGGGGGGGEEGRRVVFTTWSGFNSDNHGVSFKQFLQESKIFR